MHALLLTLIVLGAGPDAAYASGRFSQSSADIYQTSNYGGGGESAASYGAVYGGSASGCDTCGSGGGCGHGHFSQWGLGNKVGGWFGHMPQTCYDPRYGCYQGSGRFMNRYPAFHGTFYRRPYNYRNVFDYPWHAEPHEPTSLFSYNTAPESGSANVQDINTLQPPTPTPSYESARRMQPQPSGRVYSIHDHQQPQAQFQPRPRPAVGSGVYSISDGRLPIELPSTTAAPVRYHVGDQADPRARPNMTLRR